MSVEYDLYLEKHKANVRKGFEWMQENLPELFTDGSGWQIEFAHDASKSEPDEYEAYDAYFYGGNRSYKVVEDFRKAWLLHIHRNPHHWQHWVLINDEPEEGEIVLEMPYDDILEMVCDWWSFSWEKGNLTEIFEWYEEHKGYIKLGDKTRKTVEDILGKMKKKLSEIDSSELAHYGILGMHWGIRRYQNRDGTLTNAGRERYGLKRSKNKTSDNYEVISGIKKYSTPEPLSSTLKKTNPKRGSDEMALNCVSCAIAGCLRQLGYDVSAASMLGKPHIPYVVLHECFKDPNVLYGPNKAFSSRETATATLKRLFGDNASGIVGVDWSPKVGGGGHEFNWQIKDGEVSFFDAQQNPGVDDKRIDYFKYVDTETPSKKVDVTRLDNLEINYEGLKKYVTVN